MGYTISEWNNPDLRWAKARDDWHLWEAGIKKEVDGLVANKTWCEMEANIYKCIIHT